MSKGYIVDIPASTDPQEQTRLSTFTPPIFIETGDEGSENLEAKVRERTGEIVKADEDWTRLSGTRSIDSSVVGGFMFQSDAGIGCSIQVTEDESRPIRILIDREQDFGMFLVVVLRHEEWTTSGKFYLRFLRRVPVSDKQCTVGIEVPFAEPVISSSDSDTSSTEEPVSSAADARYVTDGEEQRLFHRIRTPSASLPAQTTSHALFEGSYVVPLAGRTGTPNDDEDMTDEEDYRRIGPAALRGIGGGIIPPELLPPPE